MENQTYLEILLNDHSLIERALVLLEKQAEKGDKIYPELALTLIDFLIEYGDNCHNQKEEEVYFPLLLKKGMPPQGPIAVMLEEHKGEREYLIRLKELMLNKKESGSLSDDFFALLYEYSNLTKNHIWKENDILYPMGRRFISADDAEYLKTEFEKISYNIYKTDGYERNLRLISSLEKQSGGRVNMLDSISTEVIQNMLDVLPVELSFVDENDIVKYYSKQDQKKIFTRSLSVIGRTVQQCHPPKSVHLVNKILTEMKANERDSAEFWINFDEMFVHISYYAVRDKEGKYQGCIEMVHDIKPYRELIGEKRLLD
ncbi:MAG: PAS domain-containing protein [Candidatus Kapaibacteriota bacterium]